MTEKTSPNIDKIIDVSEDLLLSKGFDNLSVNEVIKQSKIAKGTFYHYFPSKDHLLDHILHRLTERAMGPIRRTIERDDLNAADKLKAVISQSKRYKLARRRIYRAISRWIYREENVVLRHRLKKMSKKFFAADLARIFEQGNQEGVFKAVSPEITAEIMIDIMMAFGENTAPLFFKDKITEEDKTRFEQKLLAFNEIFERLLGARPGTLQVFDAKTMEEFFK